MKSTHWEIVGTFGVAVLVAGVALLSIPAAVILLGVCLIAAAYQGVK